MLLEVANVAVRYGGAVLALEQMNLDVPAGGAVALLGANGAGKTTLLRAIGGLLGYHRGAVVAGDIRLDGRSTRHMDTAQLVARGLAQTLEGRRVLSELTVAQNLRLGAFALADARARRACATTCWRYFRASASASTSARACSAAASSRCSRSGAR